MTTDEYKKALKLADKLATYASRVRSCFSRVLSDRIHEMGNALDEYSIYMSNIKDGTNQESEMHWLPIDPDNLPEGEVLAARFNGDGFKFKQLGFLSKENGRIHCVKNGSLLKNCTHYIDINKYDL
jgi:hypothetical protein